MYFLRGFYNILMGLVIPLLLAYAVMVAMPISSFGFSPLEMSVEDAYVGDVPDMGYIRRIERPLLVSYNSRVRAADGLYTVCNTPESPVQKLDPGASLPVDLDLAWWTGGYCTMLPAGTYFITTCWTAHQLFSGLLPKKTVCLRAKFSMLNRPESGIIDEFSE